MKNKFFLYILLIGISASKADDEPQNATATFTQPRSAVAALAGRKALDIQKELDDNNNTLEEKKRALDEAKKTFAARYNAIELTETNLNAIIDTFNVYQKAEYYTSLHKWKTAAVTLAGVAAIYAVFDYLTSDANNSEKESEE